LFTQVELSYRRWCTERGIEPTVIENADPHDDSRCTAEACDLIERGVDGFFTYMSDPVNIVRAGLRTGRPVPTDVGLIAQGDEIAIPFWDVGLSNVSFLGTRAGAIAGRALLDAVGGHGSGESPLPYLFTARASSSRGLGLPRHD
jgi:DNA-binding LacI/PurR family transcriptional regulator